MARSRSATTTTTACRQCGGTGRVPLTKPYQETIAAIERAKTIHAGWVKTSAIALRLPKVGRSALVMRLTKLAEWKVIESRSAPGAARGEMEWRRP